jgi:hypothetical protein
MVNKVLGILKDINSEIYVSFFFIDSFFLRQNVSDLANSTMVQDLLIFN